MERRIPDMEFLTECDNRVWGCSSKENVIYSCKLGDPTNWYSYRGIAADSYAVTVGTDGAFTGSSQLHGAAYCFSKRMFCTRSTVQGRRIFSSARCGAGAWPKMRPAAFV